MEIQRGRERREAVWRYIMELQCEVDIEMLLRSDIFQPHFTLRYEGYVSDRDTLHWAGGTNYQV
jgi:hypothetical protein